MNDRMGKNRTLYAMLDSGADTDFISDSVVRELDIWTWEKDMTVVTVDQNLNSRRVLASFTISSVDDQYEAQVDAALVGKLVTGASDIPPSERDCAAFPHLQDIQFEKARGGVEMIIGAGHAEAWLGGEVKMGSMGEPMALSTLLGWTLVGTWGKKDTNSAALSFLSAEDRSLKEDFQKIFMHDFGPISEEEVGDSRENIQAIQQLKDTIRFDAKKGKYVVGLPWKGGREHATKVLNALDSRDMAIRRLKSMVPRFRKDEPRKERVFKEMAKFKEKGYSTEIPDENDVKDAPTPRW